MLAYIYIPTDEKNERTRDSSTSPRAENGEGEEEKKRLERPNGVKCVQRKGLVF
jgi:hypothetical protein